MKKKRAPMLRDERGKVSTARLAFWLTLLVTLTLCILDAVRDDVTVPVAAYSLLGSLCVALAAWAGGPRIAQYLGPQVGRVASSIAQAIERPAYRDISESDEIE